MLGIGAVVASSCALAADDTADFFDLSLSQLLDVKITSVSKRSEAVSNAAAAVFVITAEDIRRSGVTTIPDALRLAPGIQVANIDGNKWAVSARGFNALYANKLLVLMDGRTVYSPLFSGTFWDAQDTVLRDIERIEVVRGPGATLWGSNAVNGVINIITRSARDTEGSQVTAGAGNQENGHLSLRHGGGIGERGSYRIYGKHVDRDNNDYADLGVDADDVWQQTRFGFRSDIDVADNGALTLQGDAFRGEFGENVVYDPDGPAFTPLTNNTWMRGHNLLGRWSQVRDSGDELTVQSFYDRNRRGWSILTIDRYTVDLDVDYRTRRFAGHDLLFGVGYRRMSDGFDVTPQLSVDPTARTYNLLSAYVQDDIELAPDRLRLILGIKAERNDYSGTEYQPNIRLIWTPNERFSAWGSIARAVRIPGRVEHDARVLLDAFPADRLTPVPIHVYAQGSPEFVSEELSAYELGVKWQMNDTLSLDIATFYNDYDSLRSISADPARCEPAGDLPACVFNPATTSINVDGIVGNDNSATAAGIEIAADWRLYDTLRLQGTYSLLDQSTSHDPDGRTLAEPGTVDPRHQASLRASFNPVPSVDLDLWLRYTDTVEYDRSVIDAYTAVDARLSWRPRAQLEVALVGRNLQSSSQVQFESEASSTPLTSIRRSAHLQISVSF